MTGLFRDPAAAREAVLGELDRQREALQAEIVAAARELRSLEDRLERLGRPRPRWREGGASRFMAGLVFWFITGLFGTLITCFICFASLGLR